MKFLSLLLLLSGCSIFYSGNEAPKTAKNSFYVIEFVKVDWVKKKVKQSDYIFENIKDGRILLSNSFCDEFQEQPLEQLAAKTFNTVKDFKTKVGEYKTFQNREAYLIEGSGLVDGVKVGLRLLNTRRDNCYFDFVSISPTTTIEKDSAFNDFLNAVVFK